MRKNLALLGLALAFMLLQGSSRVLAIDCSGVSSVNYQLCQSILNSGLNATEIEAIISNLEYSSKYFPDHNYIFMKNTALQILNPPNGIIPINGLYVKNAWLSLFTAMPSVIYNNFTYVPSQAKVLTGFNYNLLIPSDYSSSSYPTANQGDCKRTYSVTKQNVENKVYVNSLYQGSGKLVDILLSRDSDIKSSYNLGVDVSIKHYSWNRYCCKRRNGVCTKYCTSCDYSRTETKNDNIVLNDAIQVKLYNNTLIGDVKTIDNYGSTIKLKPNYSNSIEIGFNSSYFDFYQNTFSINYSKPPYYVYTLKADDFNQEKTSNIFKDGSNLILQNSNDCKIRAFDFFKVISNNCTSGYVGTDFNITADRFYYQNNEIVNISISPSNISVNVTYANQSKIITGKGTLIATYPINKISGKYNGKEAEEHIFVYDQSKINLLLKLFWFFLLVYLFYRILRKYWGRR